MPMNSRLLRPRSTGYTATDADAKAYIAAVETADGSKLENKTRKAIDDFVKGLKSDSIWTPLTHCCILAGARTLAGATKPLKGTAPTSVAFTSSDYDRKTGLLGSTANTKYLNSNVNSNSFTQNDFHMSVRVTSTAAGGTYWNAGSGGNSSGACEIFANSGSVQFRNQGTQNDTFTGMLDSIADFWGSSRSTSANFAMRVGAVATAAGASRVSSAPYNGTIHIFRTSFYSTLFYPGRMAWYSLGSSIDMALLRTRVNTLLTDLGSAIP